MSQEYVVDCCPYCEWIGRVEATEDRWCWNCGMQLAGWQSRMEEKRARPPELALPPLQLGRKHKEKTSCSLGPEPGC